MPLLRPDEVDSLRSLSDSEFQELLQQIPSEQWDQLAAELDAATPLTGDYANERSARNAAVINAKTAAAQEVGPLPDVANPQRRERCAADNLLFAETYFARTFYLPWAPYQRSMMDRFQYVIQNGGKEAHAVRRGGLKSTCARVSALWATVNGWSNFTVLVGATDSAASDHRKNFFDMMVSSELLLDDYPELRPLALKWRQPKKSFRLGGQILEMTHKDEKGRIVFPDIPGVLSCQAHIAPYSINSTDVSGLSFVDRLGVTQRPKLLIFDDAQTPQSANSPLMTDEREERITKTFLGLAGVGETIGAIMVCTVRKPDDLTMRFLNRQRHPDWHGVRYKSLLKVPTRTDLWDQYAAKLSTGEKPEDGKRAATAYYVEHKHAMDEGGEVAWECDKQEDEVSALQSLMTIRAVDPEFFGAEIQQEGAVPQNTSGLKLDAQQLLTRLSHVDRGEIPPGASYLTAFVDSSDQVLWWMVCGWSKDFSGWVVDYGTWPDQGREVFYKSDLAHTIGEQLPGASWEEAFVHAHNQLEKHLLTEFPSLDLILKDWSDGQQKPRIESQVMASANRRIIRPSKGSSPKPGKKPVHLWGDPVKDRHAGCEWVERRSDTPMHVQFNANVWKSHAARRLLTTVGAPSAVTLPGQSERANRMLAEHLTAELPKQLTYDGASGVAWELIPGRDNDWWDCYVGNCVAASILGVAINGESKPTVQARRTFSLPGARNGR